MPELLDYGQETADGTEQTLYETTDSDEFFVIVNLSTMQALDGVTLRAYRRVLSAAEAFVKYFEQAFADAQDDDLYICPPISAPFGVKFTIEQTAGTYRTFKWDAHSLI